MKTDKKPETDCKEEYPPARAIRYSIFLAPLYKAKFEEMLEHSVPINIFGEVEKKSLERK